MTPRLAALLATAALALEIPAAGAAGGLPEHLEGRPQLEVAPGIARPRIQPTVAHIPPVAASAAARGGMLAGATWRSIWDRDTNVPLRLYGSGVAVPGSVADPAVAAAAARRALAEHLHLLAPGASTDDFVLVSNQMASGMRVVGFLQRHRGIPVLGGQVSFRFKSDRLFVIGSEALPHVSIPSSAAPPSRSSARQAATAWIDTDFAAASHATGAGDAVILPIVRAGGGIEYHLATPVTVESRRPIGRWEVYVGPGGRAVARRQTLTFGTATLLYDTPDRWPGSGRSNKPAAHLGVTAGGAARTTDASGSLTFDGASATVTIGVEGPFVKVTSATTAEFSDSGTINDGQTVVASDDTQTIDAQLTTFVTTNDSKTRARVLNPDLPWLDQQIQVTVNIAEACNAFSDGDSINFFAAGNAGPTQCNNTGVLVDVVHHEFGHSLHAQSVVRGVGAFEGAMSEGVGDYWAATISNDSGMGRGFFNDNDALREINPAVDKVYPDDLVGQVHSDGEIYGGTMWDLRTALIAELGASEGVALANRLWYATVQNASGMTSSYVEALAADDDDGNLFNGTPNECLIQEVFGAHGLAPDAGLIGSGVGFPVLEGDTVTVPISGPPSSCAGAAVTGIDLNWKLRDGGTVETLPMEQGADAYTATIPEAAADAVIQYQLVYRFDNGSAVTLPRNPAEPFYEIFNGAVMPLYCTDFSVDPRTDGWSTQALSGADLWEWGPAPGGADPDESFSGANIFGVSLGGPYAPDGDLRASTPVIDTTGYDHVRLQYRRWLVVEDGFYDNATINADGTELWRNAVTNETGSLTHRDHEWRFHDLDLSAQAADGSVQIEFGLVSDPGVEFAGWNLDQVCIVAVVDAFCGDGRIDGEEECDDGNTADDDGCSASCLDETGGPGGDGGCGCQSGGSGGAGVFLLALLSLAVFRRRRRVV
jgi:MYXO-CTERM domain-containing protein